MPWSTVFSPISPDLLWDPDACVIRFAQCQFDLTGDLSKNRISDISFNATRFSEFNLDFQNNFTKSSGIIFDISMNSWKNFFYEGTSLKPYRRQHFEDMGISDISGNIVFIKDVSNNDAYNYNSNYTTNIFNEIKNHIVASKKISSMQHLSTDSLMYLISVFGRATNLDDLCVLFNRQKSFVWQYDGLHLENLNNLLAIRYDTLNNTTDAMNIINDNDTYPGVGDKWIAISNLFSNPHVQGNNWKNKTAYFALSLLFWTEETDIEDIEFLLYFRCSATSQITMNTALKGNISTTSNPPYISDVNSTTVNGTYGVGQNINVNLVFSEIVNIVGIPKIKMKTGNVATTLINYTSGTGTTTINFTYTTVAGDASSNLDYFDTISLILDTGVTIKSNTTSYPANLILPIPGTLGSLSANKNIIIST